MNKEKRTVRWGKTTRARSQSNLARTASGSVGLEQLKQKLLREQVQQLPDLEFVPWVRRAAEDAASLAWSTPFPLLVFPVLLEEKAAKARLQAEKQSAIRSRSQAIVSMAV